jgi:methyl-accepting chemotaxis protein
MTIARSSREQASSIDEVNIAVRHHGRDDTAQCRALVEETNAAIEQTEAQANELDRVIGVFTVGRAQSMRENPSGARGMLDGLKSAFGRR